MSRRILIAGCAIALAAAMTLFSFTAAACSFAGPVSFFGYLVIHNISTHQEKMINIDDVGIEGTCGMANPVDVSDFGVMIGFFKKVALYNVQGDLIGERTLSDAYGYPGGLDGRSLFYVTEDGDVVRIDADTGVITGVAPIDARYAMGLAFSGDFVAEFEGDSGGGTLSVYDMKASNYVVANIALPSIITSDLYYRNNIVGFHGNNVSFLNIKRGIFSYDFILNETILLLEGGGIGIAAEDGSNIAYAYQGDLRILNLTTNISHVEIQNFRADKMQLFGDYVVYDYYDSVSWPNSAIIAVVVSAVVAVVVVAVVLSRIKRRRVEKS